MPRQHGRGRRRLKTQNLALALYRNGALGFLDVVVAQTTALASPAGGALTLHTRRLEASVGLIRATGRRLVEHQQIP